MIEYVLMRNKFPIGIYTESYIKANSAWFDWALTSEAAYYTLKRILKNMSNLEYYGPDKINPYKVDAFTRGYIECALWSSDDWDDMVNNNPTPMDKKHSIEDFAHTTLSKLVFICDVWQRHMADTLEESGIEDGRAGHCLWLDQNDYGAGFGDEFHVPKELRDKLYGAAKAVKEMDLYVGENGKIYAE